MHCRSALCQYVVSLSVIIYAVLYLCIDQSLGTAAYGKYQLHTVWHSMPVAANPLMASGNRRPFAAASSLQCYFKQISMTPHPAIHRLAVLITCSAVRGTDGTGTSTAGGV